MGGSNSKESLDDTIFNLRFAAKQLAKEAQRAERDEKKEKAKAKQHLEKGQIENARIYAENALRKHAESLNYLRLSSKLDAVQSKLRSASRTQEITKQFAHMVPQINSSLQSMNPEAIASTMEKFEQVFENLDVISGTVNESLASATSVSAPVSQVDDLLGQIAAEHNIEVQAQLGETPLTVPVMRQQNPAEELEKRMDLLK